MDKIKMKKIIAVVLITAMAIGSIFASPLTLVGSDGNAKVYDETFKSVDTANSITGNWIIRTEDNVVVFENEGLRLKIGEYSLVRILSLDDATPVVYLLDGWLGATAAETVSVTINTPVTVYSANAGSTIVVLSSKTAENGYVYKGSATFINEVTSAITEVQEDMYLDLAQSSAIIEKPEDGTEIAITIEKFLAEEPKTEAETVETVVAETTEEVETEVIIAPLTKTFSYGGYEATITAYIGKAYIEYPSFVTAQEIYDAAAAAYSAYGAYLDGVYVQVVEDGLAVVTYPETYGEPEFNFAMSLLEKELPYYIASLFAQPSVESTEEVEEDQFVIAQIEPKSKPTSKTQTIIVPLTKTFSFAGYEATITAHPGKAYIEYPTFVTAQEIYDAAAAAYSAYGAYLNDVYIQVVEDGLAVVTYPETYGEPEFNFAISLLDKELPYYIASVLGIELNVESASVVAEATTEETTEAIAEEVPTETTEAVAEVTTEVSVEASADVKEEEKESEAVETTPQVPAPPVVEKPVEKKGAKFGATIGVVYGQYTEGSEFKPFIDKNIIRKIGFAPKNVVVNVDPYLTVGNFTIGLHASINVLDLKGSFTFTTDQGAIGYVSSVAKYVGRINYNGDKFNLDIDRNHSVESSSPVFYCLDKAFDSNNSLVATESLKLGFVTIGAFVDDLQFSNLLNGKNQFAGLSLSTGSKTVDVNASVIASIYSLKNIDFYPAIDATAKISNGEKLNVDIYAGIASLFNSNTSSSLNILAKTKLTLNTKAFSFGIGAAYNKGKHISNTVNNSPVTVVTAFEGQSIDVLLSTGLNLGVFSLNGSMSIPLSLNGGEKLAYNTVKTRSGNQIDITADVLSLSAALTFENLSLSGGILFAGFTGRVSELVEAYKNNTGKNAALAGLVDSELATMYAQMTVNFGGFEAYLRGDLATINGSKNVATSFGASFTF